MQVNNKKSLSYLQLFSIVYQLVAMSSTMFSVFKGGLSYCVMPMIRGVDN